MKQARSVIRAGVTRCSSWRLSARVLDPLLLSLSGLNAEQMTQTDLTGRVRRVLTNVSADSILIKLCLLKQGARQCLLKNWVGGGGGARGDLLNGVFSPQTLNEPQRHKTEH